MLRRTRYPGRHEGGTPDRIAENAQILDFELGAEGIEAVDALDRSKGTRAALGRTGW